MQPTGWGPRDGHAYGFPASATWLVYVRGTWQPASDEAQILQWLRQGYVGPQTLVQHASWPNPIQLAQVPNFAAAVGRYPRPTRNGLDPKTRAAIGWGAAEFIVFVLIVALFPPYAALGIGVAVVGLTAISISIIGKTVRSAPSSVKAIAAWFGRRRIVFGTWCAVFVVGGALAFGIHRARVNACNDLVGRVANGKSEALPYDEAMKRFDMMTEDADRARAVCLSARQPAVVDAMDAVKLEIAKQKTAVQEAAKAAAENERKQAEKEAAEKKERDAVQSFPTRSTDVKKKLGEASAKAAMGKWLEADIALDSTQVMLDAFEETSVEGQPGWIALSKQLETQRRQIQPHMDRIRDKEEAERAKAALLATLRGPEPLISAWNGACVPCERYIKSLMNDPDSYDHVASTTPRIQDAFWTCAVQFRGKNAFGAKVVNQRLCYIQGGEVMKSE